jgi:hypothetical protein
MLAIIQFRTFVLSSAAKNIEIKIFKTNFTSSFVSVWNLVSDIKGGT